MNPARRATATAVVLATAGTLLNTVTLSATAATACAAPAYTRTFYANTTFSGIPKKTDCDSVIDQSWSGAPASGLPKDDFGVRWTVTRDFGSGGPFSFAVSGTDGIRVYLDGSREVDLWSHTSGARARTVNVAVPKGRHTLRATYDYEVRAHDKAGNESAGTADQGVTTVDTTAPAAPAGVEDNWHAGTTDKVTLYWDANTEPDLAGYRVYRSRSTPVALTEANRLTATGYTYAFDTLQGPGAASARHGAARPAPDARRGREDRSSRPLRGRCVPQSCCCRFGRHTTSALVCWTSWYGTRSRR
ncbi:PA14 domain-containing protein [Streptomyces sp. NPDC046759]|uniref:PA14 domain-containing protein n=1 Tax=Streptomyces sp. NPDC046759 TaxID=3155019 RepID=UPI0033F55A99